MSKAVIFDGVLTCSEEVLLWSSGGGVAVIGWDGAKAESLLLLTNRGVSV